MSYRDTPEQETSAVATIGDIEHALFANAITLHDKIRARMETIDARGNVIRSVVTTTAGRMMIAQIIPKHPNVPFSLINQQLTKKSASEVIDRAYHHCGQRACVILTA